MAAGFDHNIILQGMQQGPSALETMRSLQDLTQNRQRHETSLASLLQKQSQEQALRDIYRTHGADPNALMSAGFGQEAFEAQKHGAEIGARGAQAKKLEADALRERMETLARPLYGLKDQAGLDNAFAFWRQSGASEQDLSWVPRQYNEQTAPFFQQLAATAMPAEKRAQFDAAATEAEKRRAFESEEKARDRANRTKNAGIMAGQKSSEAGARTATDLRKEITARPEIAKYRKAAAEFESLKELAKTSSGANDMALVFAFMKAMDPESVVRESEYSAAAATGVPTDRMKALVSRYWTGGPLSDGQRKQFIAAAKAAQSGHKAAHDKAQKTYRHIAAKHDYDLAELGLDEDAPAGGTGGKLSRAEIQRQLEEIDAALAESGE